MLKIRQATMLDIPLIRELALVAFADTYKEILTQEQIDYMLEWMYSLDNLKKQFLSGHIYHIGEFDGVTCAYTSLEQQGQTLWHLQKIYLLPQFQGRGIGKQMFLNAITFIKKVCPKATLLELNVNRNNNAKKFYEKMGMRVASSGDFSIGNGFYMNDYIMALDL